MGRSSSGITSRSRKRIAAAAAIFFMPAVASAAPTYGASVTTVPVVQNSPTPVVLIGSEDTGGGRHGEGSVRAASTLGGKALAACPAGCGSEPFSFSSAGHYDDIVIDGAGAAVPFTLHLVVAANLFQDWGSLTFPTFTAASLPGNSANFSASFFTGTGTVQGGFDLHGLHDSMDQADIFLTGQVIPTGDPGPESSETLQGGITIFHNVPLGSGGFLNLLTRTQIPITSSGPGDPGAGFSFADIVELRAEILVTGTAQVGVPLTLDLVLSGSSAANSGGEEGASATVDVGDSFGVPQDGSVVFDLPPGFSAHSASLHIVDNVVPEPACWAASGTALAALASCRHRRRRSTER